MSAKTILPTQWGHTDAAKRRFVSQEEPTDVKGNPRLFQGRPMIERDTEINGGVYVGAEAREALVVDDTRDEALRETCEDFYNQIMEYIHKMGGLSKSDLQSAIPSLLFEFTRWKMEYSDEGVDGYNKDCGVDKDQKVYLGAYVSAGIGVCRHQALFIAYILEKSINMGLIGGRVSVDRNTVSIMGSHAWVRYTRPDGHIIILDPALNFCGTLEEAQKRETWDYQRPEEME